MKTTASLFPCSPDTRASQALDPFALSPVLTHLMELKIQEMIKADAAARKVRSERHWDVSAEEYDAYASQKKLYRESAEAMVRLAEIEPGMVVVDLGCGTGVVTQEIIKATNGRDVRVIGVDFSSGMLALARRRVGSAGVEFYCEKAEHLSKVVRVKVDRVLCNAAFWHFDRDKVAAEISRILKPSGRFLIGLPPQNFKNINLAKLYEDDKRLWMIIEEMNLRGYRLQRPGDAASRRQASLDKNEVLAFLSRHKLEVKEVHSISIESSARDYVEFLRIPIMAKNSFFFNHVPDDEAQDIISVVSNQLSWMNIAAPPIGWNIHIVEKN